MDRKEIDGMVTCIFGVSPKDKQAEALEHLLHEGTGDLLLNLPVGYGKSLVYQAFPFLQAASSSLVIAPLNIIQNEQLSNLNSRSIPACKIGMTGSITCNSHATDKCSCGIQQIVDGAFKIVFCHPESLFSNSIGQTLLLSSEFTSIVKAVFIDECHVFDKWHTEFRPDYKKLSELPAIFTKAKFVGMSGTMTKLQVKNLPKKLGFKNTTVICISPDKENIFLQKKDKIVSKDVISVYENIFKTECIQLQKNPTSYPVTLFFIPMFYMSCALLFLKSLFGENKITESCYSAIFANQDDEVIQATLKDLNSENPRIRLILTTSVTGMGFDPTCITRVIHASPPRSISQYLQEIGRAGRRGQASEAILYYNKRDIAKNLPGISDDIISYCNSESCLRENLLSVFGYFKSGSLQGCACCSFCKKTCACEICKIASLNL